MNRTRISAVALAAVTLLGLGACKSSGVAVAQGGQIVEAKIEVPTDLSEGQTENLEVTIANVGVNKLTGLSFDVEMPTELIVLSQTQSPGVTWTERITAGGTKLYHYEVNEVAAGSRAEVRYHVRAAFAGRDRTGDLKVTAYSDQLPGDQLVETKFIKLRP